MALDPGQPSQIMYNSPGSHDYNAQNAGFVGVSEEAEDQKNNYQSSYASFIPSQGYPGAASTAPAPSGNNNGFRFDNVDISGGSSRFDETPFGRVQEFVSVSNRVSKWRF
jgi:hypothetical protein